MAKIPTNGRREKAHGVPAVGRKMPIISRSDPYSGLTEHQIQKAAFAAYRKRGVFGCTAMFAVPNGAMLGDDPQTRAIRGKILKDEGLEEGAPDIVVLCEGTYYLIEVKRAGGRLSQAQKDYHKVLADAGETVIVAYGFLELIRLLEDIGVIARPIKRAAKDAPAEAPTEAAAAA